MHFPTDYMDRLAIENGKIVRIVTAKWYDKKNSERKNTGGYAGPTEFSSIMSLI